MNCDLCKAAFWIAFHVAWHLPELCLYFWLSSNTVWNERSCACAGGRDECLGRLWGSSERPGQPISSGAFSQRVVTLYCFTLSTDWAHDASPSLVSFENKHNPNGMKCETGLHSRIAVLDRVGYGSMANSFLWSRSCVLTSPQNRSRNVRWQLARWIRDRFIVHVSRAL